jgi:hypothetical protein
MIKTIQSLHGFSRSALERSTMLIREPAATPAAELAG